jgi:thiaminase/transcriptional activator TenA
MSLAASLWAENADLAAAALAHPFVTGLGDATLPRERFAGYVAQDAFFLEAFARAYALGAAHSRDRAGLDAFADLLAGVRAELRLHEDYAARWGIDLAQVQPLPATLAYTDFLLATASLGGTALTCAAMVPCMRLYAFLGRSLAGRAGDAGDYAEWITTYADPGFEELAGSLERLLDTSAGEAPHPSGDAAALRRAYRRALQLEVGFFDAAWSGG